MPQIVLLGDSIFDNGIYVPGGPDVITHLQSHLPAGWSAILLARDGARVRDVAAQLTKLPNDATHLVVSAGGNDALEQEAVLSDRASQVSDALLQLADVREAFQADYAAMLDAVLARRLPVYFCTIYDPCFPDRDRQRIAVAALSLFNDVILREAFTRTLPIVDLRTVCTEATDYANSIEPSAIGGKRIAQALAAALGATPISTGQSAEP